MEFQPIQPPQTLFPEGIKPPPTGNSRKKVFIIITFVFVLITLLGVILGNVVYTGTGKSSPSQPFSFIRSIPFMRTLLPEEKQSDAIFMTILPRPIEDITITDIPSSFDVTKTVTLGNRLWIASADFVHEYDVTKKSIVASTNPRKVGACDDVAVAAGALFVACRDAAGQYTIYRVNPKTRAIVTSFSANNGLKYATQVKLFPSVNALWVATGGGIARIALDSNTITFFDRQLGLGARPDIEQIIFDQEYVWAVASAAQYSPGGVSVYTSSHNTWSGYGPSALQEREPSTVTIEGIKPVAGGIQIAFRDGRVGLTIQLVEKQYSYSTKSWIKISEKPTTGDGGEVTYAYMAQAYPQKPQFTSIDSQGLSQLTAAAGQQLPLNGRRSYILSPPFNGKRFLLTSATVDIIDTTTPFQRILVRFGEGIELNQSFPDTQQYAQLLEFQVDESSMLGLVTDSGCDPRTGCGGTQKAWLVDLNAGRLLRTYTPADGLPGGRLLTDIIMRVQDGSLDAYNKIGVKLFSIDTQTYQLTPRVSPQPTPGAFFSPN